MGPDAPKAVQVRLLEKIPTLRIPVATSIPASWGGERQCGVRAAHVCVTAVCLWDALCVCLCGCLCVFVCALFGDTCSTLLLLDLGPQSHSSLTARWEEPTWS